LKAYRQNGFAKEALTKLLAIKSAEVDQVRALIVETNQPSIALADSLGVEKLLKRAAMSLPGSLLLPNIVS
jgi:RimJ/RimL family protein N-acetyltransferase